MKRKIFAVLAAFISAVGICNAQERPETSGRVKIVSPEISGGSVTFRLDGDYATEVKLDGSWLNSPKLMEKHDGIWELTVQGLQSDFYTYNFIVDGVSCQDPQNSLQVKDGCDRRSAFFIDGARARELRDCSRRGTVEYVWYDSALLKSSRRVAVYTPYGYNPAGTVRYPVLYMLHGEAGDEDSWLSSGRVAQMLDNLILQGRAKPMILVMPDCGVPEGKTFTTSLTSELIPFIEKRYRVTPNGASRGIAGISSGGEMVLSLVRLHPELFDFICVMGAGVEDDGRLTDDFLRIKRDGIRLFWIGCGNLDQTAFQPSQVLHDALSYVHLDHTYYVNNGGHDWKNWRQYFTNFAPMLFKYYQ